MATRKQRILIDDSNERREIEVPNGLTDLTDLLVKHWIPYFECHKCGRFDYCKHAIPHPANPDRAQDIRCGIAVSALTNFLRHTNPLLEDLEEEQERTRYFDAAFHFTQHVLGAELDIGMLIDEGQLQWWQELAPTLIGSILSQRDRLNSLAAELKHFPEFRSTQAVFLLEGWSERVLLEALARSSIAQFQRWRLEVYGGKDNRRKKKLQVLCQQYRDKGYSIHIQFDADGSAADADRLLEGAGVKGAKAFIFCHDLETAYPSKLLYAALVELELMDPAAIAETEFCDKREAWGGSAAEFLRDEYGLSLENAEKCDLANTVGELLLRSVDDWWYDEKFYATELGAFIWFVRDADTWSLGTKMERDEAE